MSLQQSRRAFDRACLFCGESDPVVLDCHRLLPGSEGGKYNWRNCVSVCSNCHRRLHAGVIRVDTRKYLSTGGRYLVHWYDREGREHWTPTS